MEKQRKEGRGTAEPQDKNTNGGGSAEAPALQVASLICAPLSLMVLKSTIKLNKQKVEADQTIQLASLEVRRDIWKVFCAMGEELKAERDELGFVNWQAH